MSESTEFIRVRQIETGHQLSVPRSHAEATGGYEPLNKPAVDAAGDPLPPKYHTTLNPAGASAGGHSGEPASKYAGLKVAELKAEIAARNDGRDDEHQLVTAGNKAALVALLDEDDARLAGSTADTDPPAAPAADSQPPTDGHQAETQKENA
ncbi:hypothetical protein F9L07_25290 [Pimelobacter simplex]|uniref:Uncharacterized protein n=1 Tax=Nocardioides simplex TaxID=2045 RepID=A0A7J5DSL9_NOCSI|nr:SAP domain-containing protein [Pimelobacter simplex]KAB2807987.1 hypothetical protein F9L07_25290 [Pimelobacter simplex]